MEKRKNTIFAVAAATLIVISLGGVFWLTSLLGMGTAPEIVLSDGAPPEGMENDSELSPVLNRVEDYTSMEVTAANAVAVIAVLNRPEAYTMETRSVLYSGESRLMVNGAVYVRDGFVKSVSEETEGHYKHRLTGNGHDYIWQSGDLSYLMTAEGGFTGDDFIHIPRYEDMLLIPPDAFSDGALKEYNGSMCVYAKYIDPDTGLIEERYVDIASGLLIAAQSWDGNEKVYEMTCRSVSLDQPAEHLFVLPNNEELLSDTR